MNAVKMINYGGWPHCCKLSNGRVELVATTDVGPRLIRFGFPGGENVFVEFEGDRGAMGGESWRPYGGHRLWHAPEHPPRTYVPDNGPVEWYDEGGRLRLVQPVEARTGIQKEIELEMASDQPRVKVTHRLYNRNLWAVELAPWALSMMAPGGIAIAPLPPRGTHAENLLPANNLSLWAYTDMSDRRWTWGREYILLRQEPGNTAPQKVGLTEPHGWIAYARAGTLFVKTFQPQPAAAYPDMNSQAEFFTNEFFLEVETLGPLERLEPGTSVTHVETWHLLDGVLQPESEEQVKEQILPRLAALF